MDREREKSGKFVSAKKKSNRPNFFRSLNVKSEFSAPGLPVDHSYASTGSKSTIDHRFIDDTGVGSQANIETSFVTDSYASWTTGRRVVELEVLAKEMFCKICNLPLHLSNTVGERRY